MEENKQTTRDRFPSNSYTKIKPKTAVGAQDEKVTKVVKGKVKEKKKTFGEKLADAFIATDRKDIKEYFLFDVLIPGAKQAVEDLVHMILFNDKRTTKIQRKNGESRIRRVNVGYNSIFDDARSGTSARSNGLRTDLVFDSRIDAEEVLEAVQDRIEEYGFATMKYYYSLADMPTEHPMTKWGWRDVSEARISKTQEGYVLQMPRVIEVP